MRRRRRKGLAEPCSGNRNTCAQRDRGQVVPAERDVLPLSFSAHLSLCGSSRRETFRVVTLGNFAMVARSPRCNFAGRPRRPIKFFGLARRTVDRDGDVTLRVGDAETTRGVQVFGLVLPPRRGPTYQPGATPRVANPTEAVALKGRDNDGHDHRCCALTGLGPGIRTLTRGVAPGWFVGPLRGGRVTSRPHGAL